MPTKINRLKCSVSAVASAGLGAFTISSAPSSFRTFGASQDGRTFDGVLITEGTDWELRSGCAYTHSGTTLSRGTLEDSSTGSAIAFTTAATVAVSQSAAELARVQSVYDISYSAAIPLTEVGTAYMPPQTVAAVITFTLAASPVRGASVYLRLTADGTNSPTFTGFKEWGGSMGYDNRAGIVNQVQFWHDGFDAWYMVTQAVGATPADVVAPTISSASVANAAPSSVVLVASEAIDPSFVPATSAFTVSGHTVTAVAISGVNITLTVTAAFVNGEAARTAAYTQPGTNNVRDMAGNLLANFSSLAITNNVLPVDTTAPTISSVSVENAAPTAVVLVASETLNTSFVPATSAFTVSGHTVSAVAISGSNITLTVTPAFVNGEAARTVAYTQPGTNNVRDNAPAGNLMANFTGQAITNNVGASSQIVRLTNLVGVTETGNGTAGWNYASTTAGFASNGGWGDLKFVSSTDGEIICTLGNVSSGRDVVLGLAATGAGSSNVFGAAYGGWVEGTGNVNKVTSGGSFTSVGSVATGDNLRLKRVGSTITLAKFSGGSWTDLTSWTGASTAALFAGVNFSGSGSQANNLRGEGLA